MADLKESQMACKGASTRSIRSGGEHLEECRACKTRVAHDMVEHPFFGFRSCAYACGIASSIDPSKKAV